jgi:hypothetical protein
MIICQIFLSIDQAETNRNPTKAPTANPVGQEAEGLPQQGHTENPEYTVLIINHLLKEDEWYIFLNSFFIISFPFTFSLTISCTPGQ